MDPSKDDSSIARSNKFTQQGTVDWTRLASTAVSYTIEALSRYSAANIQPLTMELGTRIFSQFHLSSNGLTNVRHAIESLLAWFGREYALVRLWRPTRAICAAIAEFYNEEMGAEVMNQLTRSYKAPDRLTPSILQWAELYKVCAGILARTEFSVLIGQLQRRVQTHHGTLMTESASISPESLARALEGIGGVSRGNTAAITIRGETDIFWLAVICQWCFALRIEIRNSEDEILYSDAEKRDPQVTFTLQNSQSPAVTTPPDIPALSVVRQTYVLENPLRLINLKHRCFAGRVPWECTFGFVFGTDFDDMIRGQEETISVAIGTAARMLSAIVSADPRIPFMNSCTWRTHHSASFGSGFIDFFIYRFPEFQPLKKRIWSAMRTSFCDAKVKYEQQIKGLSMNCRCSRCRSTGYNQGGYEPFCQVAILETALQLAFILSETQVSSGLFMRPGEILSMYSERKASRLSNSDGGVTLHWREELGPFIFVFAMFITKTTASRMSEAMRLFTGNSLEKLTAEGYGGLAASDDGICCYRAILRDGPSDDPDCHLLHIMPGTIECNGRHFRSISSEYEPPRWRLNEIPSNIQMETHLSESYRSLKISFHLTSPDDSSLGSLRVGPEDLLEHISEARGWINCTNRECQTICELPVGHHVMAKVLAYDIEAIEGGPLVRAAFLAVARAHGCIALLRGKECLQCSIRAGVSENLAINYIRQRAWMPGVENLDQDLPKRVVIISS